MRSKKSAKNSLTSALSSAVSMLLGFVSQAIFIRVLGSEFLGLNGLYTNILTMLSFFELGIGNAIVFHLYKPLSENNKHDVNVLMNFYKKSYSLISITIFFTGLLVLPFLNIIVNDISVDISIHFVYILFLINTSSSYLFSYKKNLIIADQNAFIINIIHILYTCLVNLSQILILLFTKNYYLYLIIRFICQLLENIVASIIATKKYPYIREKTKEPLPKNLFDDIKKKIKALFLHKVGSSIINGTDNIIISSFLGVSTVGLYFNYYTIISSVNNLFKQIIESSTASVGNLLVSSKDHIKQFDVFKKIRFLNFYISCFSAVCILLLIKPFIEVWIGNKYLLPNYVTFTLIINYFQKMQRTTYQTFKDAAGIWHEDRFIPLIESIINIFISILFLKLFGLVGVFIGTICSGFVLWFYSYPKYIYTNIFKRKYSSYFIETTGYITLFLVISSICIIVTSLFSITNVYLCLLFNLLVAIIIPNIFIYFVFRKKNYFNYYIKVLCNMIKK